MNIRRSAFNILCILFVAASSALAASERDVNTPIDQFIDGFNSGNIKSAYAAFAEGPISIIDEFSPYVWLGPNAPQSWAADYAANAKISGVSNGFVKHGKPTRVEVQGTSAYVIIPAKYSYMLHGRPVTGSGQLTFALVAVSGDWKVKAWAWTGPRGGVAN